MTQIEWFGEPEEEPARQEPPEQFYVEDPDAGEEIHRDCPFCGRRLHWRYDSHRDFTIGTPRCIIHGDLDTWTIRDNTQAWGAGRLMLPGLICDPPVALAESVVPYDSHRFKAVAPKQSKKGVGPLIELLEGEFVH